MTYDFNVQYGLVAKASDATLALSCKAELHNHVLSRTHRNAKSPLT